MALNFGNGVSGGLSGASIGASVGSAIPGVGTAIGAGVGGLLGGVGSLFGSKKKKKKKVSSLDPQQQALYNQYSQGLQGQGPMAGMYNFDADQANQNFDQNIARPAYRSFKENVIPEITGQFRGKNLQNSSYLGEGLSRAGRNVQENLDAQRSDLIFRGNQDAMNRKQNGLNSLLNMNTFGYEKPKMSSLDQILQATGPAAGEWFSNYLKSKSAVTSPQQPTPSPITG